MGVCVHTDSAMTKLQMLVYINMALSPWKLEYK